MINSFKKIARRASLVILSGWLMVACSSTEKAERYAALHPMTTHVKAEIVWKTRVGLGSENHYSNLKPAVDEQIVYAADRYGLLIAHDLNTGKRLWKTNLAGKNRIFEHFPRGENLRLSAGPVLAGDLLYFASENGVLYAVDKQQGEVAWFKELPGEMVVAPTLAEGFILAHLTNGMIVALNEATGDEVWRFEDETGLLSLRSTSQPTVVNGGVVVGTSTGKVLVLILENGRLAWEERISTPKGSSDLERITDVDGKPLVVGDNLYVSGYNGETVALELRTGEVLWKRDYASAGSPQLVRNRLILVSQEDHLVALDRLGGTEIWRNADLYYRSLTPVTALEDYLIAGDRFGYLHWFDRANGALVGRLKLKEKDAIQVAPQVVGDKLLVQTAAGRLYLIKQQDVAH